MKVSRVFKTQPFQTKTGKKYYINIVELKDNSTVFMLKLLSKSPLAENQEVMLPYLLLDYQKFAISIEE
ncbi:hypothetical protein [Calditerrivibrio nitroreducens]|uniref:hypothetical protein n=1 Tax=Calditerrivibrio nitroreducens TaxID=477976 RepID=UPI003C781B98